MAMSIGLHREFSNTSTTPFTMEIRRRAWWTLFVLLSSAQLTVGRCPASLIGVTVQPPSNIRDIDLAVDMDRPAPEFDGPTVTSSLIAQLKLATIANEIQGELLTYQVPKSANAASLDDKISHWMAELPSYFNPKSTPPAWFEQPKFILLWRSYHLRIILNRPFLFQSVANDLDLDSDNQYVRSCLQTADICADSICDFFDTHTQYKRGFAWYATYWLITASFVHATCLAYAPVHSSAEQWKSQLKRAANVLGTLGSAHLMANRARRLLERLLGMSTPLMVSYRVMKTRVHLAYLQLGHVKKPVAS